MNKDANAIILCLKIAIHVEQGLFCYIYCG